MGNISHLTDARTMFRYRENLSLTLCIKLYREDYIDIKYCLLYTRDSFNVCYSENMGHKKTASRAVNVIGNSHLDHSEVKAYPSFSSSIPFYVRDGRLQKR